MVASRPRFSDVHIRRLSGVFSERFHLPLAALCVLSTLGRAALSPELAPSLCRRSARFAGFGSTRYVVCLLAPSKSNSSLQGRDVSNTISAASLVKVATDLSSSIAARPRTTAELTAVDVRLFSLFLLPLLNKISGSLSGTSFSNQLPQVPFPAHTRLVKFRWVDVRMK
ncbi:hypothetical protein B0H16DRAFT_148412 [Mycena metata]|uniref:Uncharacterized protein n=1 Tax=Mycena metata TaxID=1033252 RepID=A0AAD7JWK5_9AGAR|nr:hypothetical protein B0H16DRAFT_148412 [Mycena metata]